jgi:hypothetical protein
MCKKLEKLDPLMGSLPSKEEENEKNWHFYALLTGYKIR